MLPGSRDDSGARCRYNGAIISHVREDEAMRAAVMTLVVLLADTAHGQSTLITINDRRDHVFDDQRHLLYISQEQGTIARYDVLADEFLAPYDVGNELNGLDITPDGNDLYVAEVVFGPTQGFVRKVRTPDGTVTNLTYDLTQSEEGSWDVVIMSNDKGFFTAQRSGSGGRVPIREITLADDTIVQRDDTPGSGINGWVVTRTRLDRSADRTAAFIVEPVASKGPVFSYDAATDTFPFAAEVGSFLQNNLAAVERTGQLIAFEFGIGTPVLDPQLAALDVINGFQGGLLFSPTQDTLYMVDDLMDELVALRVGTWAELFRMDIGEDVGASVAFASGVMSISADGRRLFLSTPAGIRMFPLPDRGADDCNDNQVADLCDIACAAEDPLTGRSCTEALSCGTETDCNGNIVPDECEVDCDDNGIVDECDIAAGAADCNLNGILDSCEVTSGSVFDCQPNGIPDPCEGDCNGNGIADACDIADDRNGDLDGNGILDACEPTDGGLLIAVPDRRDHVHDGRRDILYITTTNGHIERFNTATLTALPPFAVGVKLNGIDIAEDSSCVVVAEEAQGATLGLVRDVDVTTGGVDNVFFELTSAELGAWDVAISTGGKAFFTTDRSGSGGRVPIRELDLAAHTVIEREDALGSGFDGGVVKQTRIDRGAERTLLFFVEPVASKGPIFTYDAATDTFPHAAEVSSFLQHNLAAVSRDATAIAFEFGANLSLMNPDLTAIDTIEGTLGGVAFSPVADILFGVDDVANEVVAFDMISWNELYRLPIGENIGTSEAFGSGVTSMSADGRLLFVSTSQGVRMIRIPGLETFDCDDNGASDICDLDCAAVDPVTGLACSGHRACGQAGDCNANDRLDLCDVQDGASPDVNRNTVPDECESCRNLSDCADRDGDDITDDACMWHACGTDFDGLCTSSPRSAADYGGPFGACAPDGIRDGHDRYHALNCFADQNTAGHLGYPCEPAAPAAYNVDGASPDLPCTPDGFCDAADALQVIDIFGGDLSCTCTGGPQPMWAALHPHDGARVDLVAAARAVRPGHVVEVQAILRDALPALRAYQLHLAVRGGTRGQLMLVDIAVDSATTPFDTRDVWTAFNVHHGQMARGVTGSAQPVERNVHLATFTYLASPNAAGDFVVELQHDRERPDDRTFLFADRAGQLIPTLGNNRNIIHITRTHDGPPPTRITRKLRPGHPAARRIPRPGADTIVDHCFCRCGTPRSVQTEPRETMRCQWWRWSRHQAIDNPAH